MISLSAIKGIGPARLEALRAVGICSLRDLLYCLPQRYEDRTTPVPCREAQEGPVLLRGVIQESPRMNRYNGLTRVSAILRDDTGSIAVSCFNQPWMMQQLTVGQTVMLYGRITVKNDRRTLVNPVIVKEPSLVPVYKPVAGFRPKSFRTLMETALEHSAELDEPLPHDLLTAQGLMGLQDALRQAHFPQDMEKLKAARKRLAFEQMMMYFALLSQRSASVPGIPMEIPPDAAQAFWQTLPFPPTNAQRRVLDQIIDDLRKSTAMARLVQGDVGCGKTAIAFGSIACSCRQGFQCAMMAPTEILARQHYLSAKTMLEPLGIRCGLLLGSMKARQKKEARAALASGEWQAVFGTHALISKGVIYQKLGLVITDEQHRFGVRQRSALQEKGHEGETLPHVLVMSATPIPRSLALILYGDLQVSVVDELPPGRQPVKTRMVQQEKRGDMYGFLRKQIAEGHQAYVVCPLVEDSEQLGDVRSAASVCDELMAQELKGLRVGLTWGAQKQEDKAAVLDAFTAGEMDVLVSTTVIEVGVNVPNASVMVIQNAERFGLSQLHQLRGRVGRGNAESWCFLLAGQKETKRLRTLVSTNDGFEVARVDLQLRGPGDLMGTRQSGESLGGMLLDGDVRMLELAHDCMKQLREDASRAESLHHLEEAAAQRYSTLLNSIALN